MIKRLLCLGLVLLLTQGTKAGFEIGITGPGEYSTALAGTSVVETIFIRATPTDTLNSLFTYQFSINAGAGGTTITNWAPNFAFTPNTSGAFAGGTLSGTSVGVTAIGNQVNLGNITFLLGPIGSHTPINILDTNGSPGTIANTNLGGATVLDGLIYPHSQLVSVPEPGSLGLGLVALGLVAYRRRRK